MSVKLSKHLLSPTTAIWSLLLILVFLEEYDQPVEKEYDPDGHWQHTEELIAPAAQTSNQRVPILRTPRYLYDELFRFLNAWVLPVIIFMSVTSNAHECYF